MAAIRLRAVGADPEVFFKTKDGIPHSVENIIRGTKFNPYPIPKYPEGFFVQADNVAAEFNIPPAGTSRDFSLNIGKALKFLSGVAKKHKMVISLEPALDFPIEQLMTPHAMELGCEPDFNAWTGEKNPRPKPPREMRTAAGHVHLGWVRGDEISTDEDRMNIIKLCDAYLGVPSILATEPSRRRDLYGKAGAMRFKEYGAEYRTLESFWIGSKELRTHVFEVCGLIFAKYNTHRNLMLDLLDDWSDEIQECINNHDRDSALELMDIFNAAPFPVVTKED